MVQHTDPRDSVGLAPVTGPMADAVADESAIRKGAYFSNEESTRSRYKRQSPDSQSSNRRVRNRSPGPESEDDRDLPSDHEGTLAADKATKDPPQKPPCTHKALHKPRPAPSRTEDSESTGEDDPIEPESNDEDLLVPEDYEKKKRKSSKALSKKKSAEKPLLPLSDLQLHDADEKPSEKSPDALPDCEKKRSEKCPAEPHHDEKPPEKRSPMIPPEPHQAERTKTRIRIPPRPRVFYQRFARKEFMPEEQQAQYWYEKSYISMMEQDRLHDSVAHLEMTVAKLRSLLDEETHRSEVSRQNYLKEMTQLDSKIQDLHAIHIKSVNSVDTGLEPITDQAFQTRFRTLQDDVNEWSRKSFKHKGERIELEDVDDVLKEILSPRFKRTKDLSFSLLMDSIAWAFMESRIFCLWFPGMSEEWQGKMEYLEGFVRGGDKSKTQEKAEYWRAYTKSLLFQNPQTKEGLTQVAQMATELIECLHSVQNEGVFRPGYIGLVEDSIKSSMTLAAEIKCQRGAYELDSSVHLGDPFDETKMVNVIFSDDYEVGTEAIVSGIVSNGWVRKSYAGSTDIEARICKARVVVVYSERP